MLKFLSFFLYFFNMIKEIIDRVHAFCSKMISVKGLVLVITGVFVYKQVFTEWLQVIAWFIVIVLIIGLREAKKWFDMYMEYLKVKKE